MTTATAIEVFQQAEELGLRLGVEPPDTLTLQPANRCSLEFANRLRACKPELLALLRLPFCMVYSEALQETIFFCADEKSKAALVEAGADPWSIYTKDELRGLVAHNRANPFIPDELLRLHQAKRTFNARFAK
jgi:hypothetical protein